MTKLQTWNEASEILSNLTFKSNAERDNAFSLFEKLLAPKKSGGITRPADIIHNGEKHRFCRFTNLYFPLSEMIFQNQEKREKDEDKGYSNIGYSIWNKAQKYIKDLPTKSIEIRYGSDQSDEMLEKAIKMDKEYIEIKSQNLGNNAKWLMENFLSESQADSLESLDLPEIS